MVNIPLSQIQKEKSQNSINYNMKLVVDPGVAPVKNYGLVRFLLLPPRRPMPKMARLISSVRVLAELTRCRSFAETGWLVRSTRKPPRDRVTVNWESLPNSNVVLCACTTSCLPCCLAQSKIPWRRILPQLCNIEVAWYDLTIFCYRYQNNSTLRFSLIRKLNFRFVLGANNKN